MISKRCLLLGCTKAKRPDADKLAALYRYDGPYFRVYRRYLNKIAEAREGIDLFILSAQYGLISEHHMIPVYDCRMTKTRIGELRPQVSRVLKRLFNHNSYSELFVLLGADYFSALPDLKLIMPATTNVILSKGAQGVKARQLKYWLYGNSIDHKLLNLNNRFISKHIKGMAYIRGLTLSLSPLKVLELIRKELIVEEKNWCNFRDWYVQIDGKRVSPKWIVSRLTQLPVASFTSGEARRVLCQLGIPVKRVGGEYEDIHFKSREF